VKIKIEPKEINRLLPTDILFQTSFWSYVKYRLGWTPHAFDFLTEEFHGDVLVLIKSIGQKYSIAYVPQGPEYGPDSEFQGLFLEELSRQMIKHLDQGTVFIRYDLPWESPYAKNDNCNRKEKNWTGHPDTRLRELRMNFGTKDWNLKKATLDIVPADSLILKVASAEEEILADMKSKTRYNIRLAEKKGVKVFQASIELLPVFYKLYAQTARRNGIYICDYKHFVALFSALADAGDSTEIHFLLAGHDKEIIAGAIIAISGRTGTYLFGASSNNKRNFMGSYALQWAAIQLVRQKGCLTYDMGAVSPTKDPCHPFYGLYRFKTGFGGRIIHKNGSWDYPLDIDKYEQYRNLEILDNACNIS